MRPMRRTTTVIFLILLSSIAVAQVSDQATFRTAATSESITTVQQNGIVYLPIDRIVTSLGGEFSRTDRAFTVVLDGRKATFGPGDLEAVVGEDFISFGERPPIVIEGRPFVPIQFLREFLRPAELEPAWDPGTKVLAIQPLRREIVNVEPTVTSVGPLTKIIFEMSRPANFSIVRRSGSYVVQFRNPIRSAAAELPFDDPLVSRIVFGESSLEVVLRTPQVAADSYKLENPPRLVLDLTRSASTPATAPAPAQGRRDPVDTPGIDTIVIDPGHGGKEVGARGPTGALEKELTLSIARKVRDQLAARGFRVILTRNEDVLLDLDQRPAIANQYKADLFLSIHLNAVPFKSAYGAETYFLSLESTDERARLSAERENSIGQPTRPAGSDLDLILWDLAQQRYLKESSRFAELIQDEMATTTGVERRGVKQAPFRVLLGATMPAALVEVGFISNPEEEGKLRSDEYQTRLATALSDAVSRYKSEYEKRAGVPAGDQTRTARSTPGAPVRSEP